MRATVTALLLTPAVMAAPKLPPAFEFVSHHADGGGDLVDFRGGKAGVHRFRADFTVRGPAGKYVVELWVEAGTGEKVQLIDRQEVEIPPDGTASGKFDRHELDVPPGREQEGKQPLPKPLEYYWSYRLTLTRGGDDPVADTGVEMVPWKSALR